MSAGLSRVNPWLNISEHTESRCTRSPSRHVRSRLPFNPHTRAHTHLAKICMLLTALTHSITEGMRSYSDCKQTTSNTKPLSAFRNWQKDIPFTNERGKSWVPNLSVSLFVGVHKHTRAQNLDLFLWTSWESRNEALKTAPIPSVCLVFLKQEMRRWHLI